MGIDAAMLLINRGEPFSENKVRQLASALCERIGPQKFYIERPKNKYSFPESHAISIIKPYMNEYGYDSGSEGKVVFVQDGPNIEAKEGEQFLRVHLKSRYWGPDYERGDWLTIKATAEFLEFAEPSLEIYYGGDSSVLLEVFDLAKRSEFHQHWLKHGHEPYYAASCGGLIEKQAKCDFCAGRSMVDSGGGQGVRFFRCTGCGLMAVKGPKTHGVLCELPNGSDFFDWQKQLLSEAQ